MTGRVTGVDLRTHLRVGGVPICGAVAVQDVEPRTTGLLALVTCSTCLVAATDEVAA